MAKQKPAHMHQEFSPKCPENKDVEAISAYLRDRYCEHCAQFDEKLYLENWHRIYLVTLSFICRFNRRAYGLNHCDPVMSILASEIWLHNIGRLIDRNPACQIADEISSDEKWRDVLPKCNAFSLAQYLGLPPQTVRRKIQNLIDLGWVIRTEKGELCASSLYESSVMSDCNLETMRDFVSTARTVLAMLDSPLSPAKT